MKEFLHIASAYIPPTTSPAYQLLALFADGENHKKTEIIALLGDDPRSALQQLRSERFGYWNILNVGDVKGVYLLDPRHLSGNPTLDVMARLDRELTLRDKSYQQAVSEASRQGEALEKFMMARQKFQFDLWDDIEE